MTTDRDPGPHKKASQRSPSAVEDKILRDLSNAFTALGFYLARAIQIRQSGARWSTDRIDQMLEKSREQHERAVWALRELRKALQK